MREALVLSVALCAVTLPAEAQEFRVVTTVRSLDRQGQATGQGLTTLTLFRHRKVYDYIDTLGEVIVLEPSENRFTILNVRRSLATTVNFDEIKKLLRGRKPQVEQYVAGLRRSGDHSAEAVAASFEFQFRPKFEESFDSRQHELALTSPLCSYVVRCANSKQATGVSQRYLEYADWMARLNSVLHPAAGFPEPRIAVNSALRRHKTLPVRVELNSRLDGERRLRAEHRIGFALDARDRQRITDWEAAIASPNVTKTTFRRYQASILASR